METDGILTFKGRVVILREQCGQVLEHLHTAHQGVTKMMTRATCSIWWPELSKDVGAIQDACGKGKRDTRTNPRDAPDGEVEPVYPFQMICREVFALQGMEFLVLKLSYCVQNPKSDFSRGGIGTEEHLYELWSSGEDDNRRRDCLHEP